ncbi:Putative magnesium-dependent phosphatase P8B7.31, partial [Termitomyces sp. J132]
RLPKLIAFDLDYTLWDLWIDTHVTGPLHRNRSTLNEILDKHNEKIKFYKDVPDILHRLRAEKVIIAACSRTHAPKLYVLSFISPGFCLKSVFRARQALSLLLIAPKPGDGEPIPAVNFFNELEIYPGSKLTHFDRIHQKTGIPYSEMFFDDEHLNAEVEELGVTFCLVPQGVDRDIFEKGLAKWRKR